MKSRLLTPLAALTAAAPLAFGTAPSAHATSGTALAICPRGSGVTVIVDFGSWDKRSCAPGDPTTGLAALRGAGFTVTMVQRFPGAVCRINGRPSATVDKCVVMPPTTGYWSYWQAVRGGKWTYSTSGPGSYNPKPGTVEGWSYGAGKPPTAPPPA
ncbi:MAG: hypothetical protein LCH82_09575 [Actinobacteria bacterium]|nr:hypothetical protein [Actinomycetota bacterium]